MISFTDAEIDAQRNWAQLAVGLEPGSFAFEFSQLERKSIVTVIFLNLESWKSAMFGTACF